MDHQNKIQILLLCMSIFVAHILLVMIFGCMTEGIIISQITNGKRITSRNNFGAVKTIISIATTGTRPHQLARTIDSLMGQADEIRVYDNSRFVDYADNAKFYPLQFITEPCYLLTCDDDLIYPPTYVIDTKMFIDRYHSIVSWHGRILKPDQATYYNSGHEGIQHWKPLDKPMRLDVAGTGCTGFRTDYFNPIDIFNSEYKRMSDLVFSLEAWKQGKQIISPPKRLDYILEQEVESSIFGVESKTDQQGQIWHTNQILMYKNSLLNTTT